MESIAIIGAGKLGSSLFRALKMSGYKRLVLCGRELFAVIKTRYISQKEYINKLNAQIVSETDVVFIAVQDDRIAGVSEDLQKFELTNKFILHTSGARDSKLLDNLKIKGAVIGSFHPMQTFERNFLPPSIWKNVVCSYEGDERGKKIIKDICSKLHAKTLFINKEQKSAMHLAGVVSSNYIVSLLIWAERILDNAGIKEIDKTDILYPLIDRTVQNYKNRPLQDILSGPLKRGDLETIQKHLDYLNHSADKLDIELYKKLAELILSDERFNLPNRKRLVELLAANFDVSL